MSKKQIVQAQDEWAQDQPSGIQKIFEHWKRSMRDSKQKEREREYELAQNLSREALTIFKKIRGGTGTETSTNGSGT
uniref:Uncharacterized protein n=1 Tax=Acrobeloides nanus TaxID=290746 RepID=A0A914D8T1_9BILA